VNELPGTRLGKIRDAKREAEVLVAKSLIGDNDGVKNKRCHNAG
jgi:hypothetical protein